MISVNTGELRERVGFYQLLRVTDEGGGSSATETLIFETWGKVTPMNALSTIEAGKYINVQPYQVTVRYSDEREPVVDMIMKYRDRRYIMRSVQDRDVFKKLIQLIATTEST